MGKIDRLREMRLKSRKDFQSAWARSRPRPWTWSGTLFFLFLRQLLQILVGHVGLWPGFSLNLFYVDKISRQIVHPFIHCAASLRNPRIRTLSPSFPSLSLFAAFIASPGLANDFSTPRSQSAYFFGLFSWINSSSQNRFNSANFPPVGTPSCGSQPMAS